MSKWCCTVIRNNVCSYRAILQIGGYTVEGLPENVGYLELRNSIKRMTGKEIPH